MMRTLVPVIKGEMTILNLRISLNSEENVLKTYTKMLDQNNKPYDIRPGKTHKNDKITEEGCNSSSSSCRAASTDIPDPLLSLLPIVHRLWQVFRATSRILTEVLYVCWSWSSCFCSAICGGP